MVSSLGIVSALRCKGTIYLDPANFRNTARGAHEANAHYLTVNNVLTPLRSAFQRGSRRIQIYAT